MKPESKASTKLTQKVHPPFRKNLILQIKLVPSTESKECSFTQLHYFIKCPIHSTGVEIPRHMPSTHLKRCFIYNLSATSERTPKMFKGMQSETENDSTKGICCSQTLSLNLWYRSRSADISIFLREFSNRMARNCWMIKTFICIMIILALRKQAESVTLELDIFPLMFGVRMGEYKMNYRGEMRENGLSSRRLTLSICGFYAPTDIYFEHKIWMEYFWDDNMRWKILKSSR